MTSFITKSEAVLTIVQQLPQEISLYIYTEFLETECKYEVIMREFRSHRVQRLCTEYLKMMMISHFSNKKLISYLRKREENFDYYYGKIILRGEKIFSSMTQNNAVINSWVMITYH